MNKPIVSIWGLGPSYRDRVKHNIQKAIDTGYDNVMDYVVLTDVPEDFYDFRDKTKKIVDIVNIHEIRDSYPFSKELEFFPTNQEAYGKDYVDAYNARKYFSYSLNRFSLKRISELGYNRFIMQDPDADIRYDKVVNGQIQEIDFWNQFDTPINSMKACHKETIILRDQTIFKSSDAIGPQGSLVTLQIVAVAIDRLNSIRSTRVNPLKNVLDVTEGPFKYYHLESPDAVRDYFEVLNECVRTCYSSIEFKMASIGGGYMLCDFIPVATANVYKDISVINFENDYFTVNVYGNDRYFMPKPISLPDGSGLIPAQTLEEFYIINKDKIQQLESTLRWPKLF